MDNQNDQLEEHIVAIRDGLVRGDYKSEAAISSGVVIRLLTGLAWPPFDARIVFPQFPIETRKVDFALCDPPGKPRVLIEVKAEGSADQKGEDQLFQYCFRKGVKLAVLTDGSTWKLYYPYGDGEYSDRLFRDLDIINDGVTSIAETLRWFLAIDAVESGVAFERCEAAYAKCVSQRKAAEAFSSVWDTMLMEPDEELVDHFSKKVEKSTGIHPEPDAVFKFFGKQAGQSPVKRPVPPPDKGIRQPERGEEPSSPFYSLYGVTTRCKTGKEVLVGIFREFAKQSPNFCERYAMKHAGGRARRELARSPEDLYPAGSKLARTDASQLPGGWWIGTHLNNSEKVKRIQRACELMGIEYGRELHVSLSK